MRRHTIRWSALTVLVLVPGCAGRPAHRPPSSLTLASFNVRILSTASRTAAELAVSDHRPIWARFHVTGPDDD